MKQDIAQKLQKEAARSLGSSRGPLAEQRVRCKVKSLRKTQDEFAELGSHLWERLAQQAYEALPEGPHRRIQTIPGIGLQNAAAGAGRVPVPTSGSPGWRWSLAKIVSIERFATADALVGYFGVFPEEVHVSGTDRQGRPQKGPAMRMSRKGNDLAPGLLCPAAQCAIRHNPPVQALACRLAEQGKAYHVCMGHCMAKLLRQVFALWTKVPVPTSREREPRSPGSPDFDAWAPTCGNERREQAATVLHDDQGNDEAGQETTKAVGHKAVEPPQQEVTDPASWVPASGTIAPGTNGGNRPFLNFALLRERISIKQVLEHLAWHPQTTRGAIRRGSCLLHEPQATSSRLFAVQTEKNVYYGHGCGSQGHPFPQVGAQGTRLDLWAAVQGLPILEAAWTLVETFDFDPPLMN